jgi:hypothetical protein
VLGAANKRLYQFRLQTADSTYEKAAVSVPPIASLETTLVWCMLRSWNKCARKYPHPSPSMQYFSLGGPVAI